MGCVFVYVLILTIIGPEKRGKDLSVQADEDTALVTREQDAALGHTGHGEKDISRAQREQV